MKKSAYEELARLEKTYWWHVGRLKILEKQLAATRKVSSRPFRILNVGSGTGGTIPMLEKFGTVINVDVSKDAIRYTKKSGHTATQFDGVSLPFRGASFDVVVALDVLEHTKDDVRTAREWFRVLRPNGTFLITVPAYQWLWSEHDEANKHYRRYTRKSLKNVLHESGVGEVKKIGYMMVFSLPLIAGYRSIKNLQRQTSGKQTAAKTNVVSLPAFLNQFFILLLATEGRLQTKLNFPFGTSVIARVTKPPSPRIQA